MSILSSVMLTASVFLLLAGTLLCVKSHDKFRQLVLYGCLHDVGIVCLGLACPLPEGKAGALMYLLFQVAARGLAWSCLPHFALVRASAKGSDLWTLRGIGRLMPRTASLFSMGMLAAIGGSIFLIPEGRYLISAASVGAINESSWYLYILLLAAATTTVQVWLAVRVVCTIMLDKAPAGLQIDASLDKPSTRPLACAAAILFLGLFRGPLLSMASFFGGFETCHGSPHAAFWLLYLTAFGTAACSWLCLNKFAALVAVAGSVVAFLSVLIFPAAPLAQLFLVLVCLGSIVISIYSIDYMAHGERKGHYWFFLILTFASLAGIVSSDNAAGLYGYWELMTFASFFLVAHEANVTARTAGVKYYVMCAGGAMFMLPGILLLSGTGALGAVTSVHAPNMALAVQGLTSGWFQAACVLCLAGFGVKAGIVPLHSWLPDAHPAAPSSVSGPLSGIITKMGFFGLAAVVAGQSGSLLASVPGYFGLSWFGTGMVFLGCATLFYGEIMALRQKDIKRMLAYSTLGQIGEITIVLGLGTVLATTAAFYHILNHAVMKDLLFLGAGAIILRAGSRNLDDFAGACKQMPITCICILVGLISIMGLPPFAAFYSKFMMIQAAVASGHVCVAAMILLGSFIGVIYYTRILNTLIFKPRPENAVPLQEAPLSILIAIIALAAASLLFGLMPSVPAQLASAAAIACTTGAVIPQAVLTVQWPIYVVLPIFGAIIPAFFKSKQTFSAYVSSGILALTALLVLLCGRDLDNLSFAFAFIVPALGAINMAYAAGYMSHSHTQWRFYCLFTAMCGGLIGMAASETLFSFFLFWEIMSSWTLYMVLAHEGDKLSLREAGKYFLFNIAGASFIFVGVCLIGGTAPMSFFADKAILSNAQSFSYTAGLAMLAIGFVMKGAQFPIRIDWQMHPAVAPTPVSGYISSMLLKSSIIGLCKLFLILGAGTSAFYSVAQSYFIMWVGGLTILIAAAQAMRCNQVKLVFIYSTVSQIGYMVLAIAVGGYALAVGSNASLGISGALLHLINHVFFKDLLFLICGAIMFMTHKEYLSDLGGLGRRMPFTMTMFFIAGLSVVGVPPTSGFASKWIIYHALMQSGQPILALMSLFGSVLTLAYIAKFMHAAFLGQPNSNLDHVQDPPMLMRIPMLLLAIGCIVTGLFPGLMMMPINAILTEFAIPALPYSVGSIGNGATGWSPFIMFVLMAVPFAGGCWVIRRFVRIREVDVHNCGLEPEDESKRMAPASIYGSLPAFMRTLSRGRED